jgi:hypothetical protein
LRAALRSRSYTRSLASPLRGEKDHRLAAGIRLEVPVPEVLPLHPYHFEGTGKLLDLQGNRQNDPYDAMIQGLLGERWAHGALLYIPFLRQGTLLGALLLRHPHEPDAFTLRDMQLLEFLAGQTGLALENMYLRKAISDGRRKFKTLFDVVDVDGIEEQLRAWYTQVRRARDPEGLARAYQGLFEVAETSKYIRVLPFTSRAVEHYLALRRELPR